MEYNLDELAGNTEYQTELRKVTDTIIKEYEISVYKSAYHLGLGRGLLIGSMGTFLGFALAFGTYKLIPNKSETNLPSIEQVQPQPTHTQTFTQSDLSKELNKYPR